MYLQKTTATLWGPLSVLFVNTLTVHTRNAELMIALVHIWLR